MKKKYSVPLLLILLFLPTLVTAQATPVLEKVSSLPVNSPSVSIYSMTPYDHGLVLVLGYSNFTYANQQQASTLCIYFLNKTESLSLYKSTVKSIILAYTFVKGGELYALVDSETSSVSHPAYQTNVYVFRGLRLVNTQSVDGLLSYAKGPQGQLFNLSAMMLTKFALVFPHFYFNYTFILNTTNITLINSIPLIWLQLKEGVLIASMNLSYLNYFEPPPKVFINFTLFSYDGKVIWSKGYNVSNPYITSEAEVLALSITTASPAQEGFATIIGDELYLMNVTTPLPPVMPVNARVNTTIVGVDLQDGEVNKEINLMNITLNWELLNIGGKLYVLTHGSHEIEVREYNGTGLTLVARVPVMSRVEEVTYPGGHTLNCSVTLTDTVYDFGKYLLVINPTLKGSNITDVYQGGVTNYILDGNVSDYVPASYVLLLNKSGNFSLAFLYSNGTIRGTVNVGNVSVPPLYTFLKEPGLYLTKVDPYKYYLLKVHSYPSGKTVIILYEVAFPNPVIVASLVRSLSKTSPVPPPTITRLATPSTPLVIVVIIVAVAVIAVVGILLMKRKK
ncbi:hypothetical protein [Stygiolobus caldivivus]|uniref:Uncharacterized protein n=1 Tax=Stygiolobus caldivivus TaxID=2824673 RepID=A0A8D5ZJK0_9CREN|nr:hypothetical protein [Stygiolobus caldivivus]BCU71669.1 hypothetical protein KN1_29660 [Stygiolobus caldivivus]